MVEIFALKSVEMEEISDTTYVMMGISTMEMAAVRIAL